MKIFSHFANKIFIYHVMYGDDFSSFALFGQIIDDDAGDDVKRYAGGDFKFLNRDMAVFIANQVMCGIFQ